MADGGTETDQGTSGTSGAVGEVPGALLTSVAAPMIQILGLFLTVGAFLAWRGGRDVELPTVGLVLAAVVVVVGIAFAWRGDALLGLVVSGRPLTVAAVFVALCGIVLAAVVLLPPVHLTLSTLPVAIIGVASLLGPLVEAVQHRRASMVQRGAGAERGAPDRLFNTVLAYLVWQVPLAAVLLVAVLWMSGAAA